MSSVVGRKNCKDLPGKVGHFRPIAALGIDINAEKYRQQVELLKTAVAQKLPLTELKLKVEISQLKQIQSQFDDDPELARLKRKDEWKKASSQLILTIANAVQYVADLNTTKAQEMTYHINEGKIRELTFDQKAIAFYYNLVQPKYIPDTEQMVARDILFIVDSSGSIATEDFTRALACLKDLVRLLYEKTLECTNEQRLDLFRFAGFSFSDAVDSESSLRFTPNPTMNDVQTAIIKLKRHGGGTSTSKAIDYAHNEIFRVDRDMRRDSVKQVIIVTDGMSDDPNALEQAIGKLKSNVSGIEIFALAIGNYTESVPAKEQLEMVVSWEKSRITLLESYSALATLLLQL